MKISLSEMLSAQTTWKRWSAAAVLLSAITSMPPAFAADPPAGGDAVLNFVGAEIDSVVKAIGAYTNITFIVDPRVKGTINLVSEKPLSKAKAFEMLTAVLRLQGFTIVPGDGFSKVVPESDAKLQANPVQTSDIKGDQIVTQIFRLNYESAGSMVAILRPLISPNNTVNANPGNNSIVITDYANNITRLGKIIAALDSPSSTDVDVIPIRYAIASDIAALASKLLEPGAAAGSPDAGRVSLFADSRTNSVIMRSPSAARASLAMALIAKLDQPTAQPGNVHVVYLKNADATKLAQTLRAVVTSDGSAPSGASAPAATPPPPAQPGAGIAAPPSTPATPALSSGGAAGFIQADQATNTLIITASEPVYRNLRAVIDQLDVRRAQVYVESLIVEVSASKAAEFGIQWLGATGNDGSNYRVGAGTSFSSGGNNLLSLATGKGATLPGNGFSLGLFRQINGALGLGALAHALETDADANVLSMPNLITLDNEEAKIIVGQNVPFITGQYTTSASGGGAGVNPFQTVERKDVGLSLRVRPQISEGGTVKMAIYQETSSVQNSANAAGIITSKRSIDTNVLVDDGQIIVLGGLIEENVQDDVEKVRGLGDIPLVGNLFKYQTRKRGKTNLMVFLRPTVIRSNDQSIAVATDRYDFMRNVGLNAQPNRTILLPEMNAPVLPTLEKGVPMGGNMLKIDPALLSMKKSSASAVPVTEPKKP